MHKEGGLIISPPFVFDLISLVPSLASPRPFFAMRALQVQSARCLS